MIGRLSGIGIQSGQTKINLGRVWALPRLCELYPGICLTPEEKHGKTSVRVAEECQLARRKHNIQNRTYITIRVSIYKHNNKNTRDSRIISDYYPNKWTFLL